MQSLIKPARDFTLVFPFVTGVFPMVDRELSYWSRWAADIADPGLRKQAMASIAAKKFHCQGGSVYCLYCRKKSNELLSFIVALQTISDYLDNLCDRVTGAGEQGFRALHRAMIAAVEPGLPLGKWYEFYPLKEDSGYLDALVSSCRNKFSSLVSSDAACQEITALLSLYSDLQVYKHLHPSVRERRLVSWFQEKNTERDLYWWEFAAAAGSTLGVFALVAAAAGGEGGEEIANITKSYFPWVCSLHIMLDYFIDMDEDKAYGDLNFAAYYRDKETMEEGLLRLLDKSTQAVRKLNRPVFHNRVINGLLALYLSDPKALHPQRQKITRHLLSRGGGEAQLLHRVALYLRSRNKI